MHIPDGFVSPRLYLPAAAVAAGVGLVAARRARGTLRGETLPTLAVGTALAYVLMSLQIPLPGGTSAHASGVALLALLHGVPACFLCISLVLLLQSLMFGIGGITSLPLNALAMGLAGGATARCLFHLFAARREGLALFLAGWAGLVVPALLLAVALGVQPHLARTADGLPLFFPFGLRITLPAVLVPHAFVGIGEGLLTLGAYRVFRRLQREVAG